MITLTAINADTIEWVADGKVIATGASIDLRAHAEEITCYVRAQLLGPGGISLTQAFTVEKGDGYRHPDDALKGWDWFAWYMNMWLHKNPIAMVIDRIVKLLK